MMYINKKATLTTNLSLEIMIRINLLFLHINYIIFPATIIKYQFFMLYLAMGQKGNVLFASYYLHRVLKRFGSKYRNIKTTQNSNVSKNFQI